MSQEFSFSSEELELSVVPFLEAAKEIDKQLMTSEREFLEAKLVRMEALRLEEALSLRLKAIQFVTKMTKETFVVDFIDKAACSWLLLNEMIETLLEGASSVFSGIVPLAATEVMRCLDGRRLTRAIRVDHAVGGKITGVPPPVSVPLGTPSPLSTRFWPNQWLPWYSDRDILVPWHMRAKPIWKSDCFVLDDDTDDN